MPQLYDYEQFYTPMKATAKVKLDLSGIPLKTLASIEDEEGEITLNERVTNNVMEYVTFTKENGYFYHKRQEQNLRILQESIENGLRDRFYNQPGMEERIEAMSQAILDNKISAYAAADELLG